MKSFRFYKKEYRGKVRWWIDIKPWFFPRRLLIMYPSAEQWLDKISGNQSEVIVAVSVTSFSGAEALWKHAFEGVIRGTTYMAKTYHGVEANHQILLCPVTLYVFGKYPKIIYYRVLEKF